MTPIPDRPALRQLVEQLVKDWRADVKDRQQRTTVHLDYHRGLIDARTHDALHLAALLSDADPKKGELMITREYELTVQQTRGATVTVVLHIEAVDERNADLARDDIYETIDRFRKLAGPLQHITATVRGKPTR